MKDAVQQGHIVCTYTTENTTKSLLEQMESLSLDVSDYFVLGRIKVFPIQSIEERSQSSDISLLDIILKDMQRKKAEVVLIDSLTVFVTHSGVNEILNFFAACKKLCDYGKTILITVHEYAFNQEMLTRVRSICDVHISLRLEAVGDKLLKTMEVAKVRGARQVTGSILSFAVEPKLGLRLIPISRAMA